MAANGYYAEICSKIGLEIERSDTLSDRVCHACARKIRNACLLEPAEREASRDRRFL